MAEPPAGVPVRAIPVDPNGGGGRGRDTVRPACGDERTPRLLRDDGVLAQPILRRGVQVSGHPPLSRAPAAATYRPEATTTTGESFDGSKPYCDGHACSATLTPRVPGVPHEAKHSAPCLGRSAARNKHRARGGGPLRCPG